MKENEVYHFIGIGGIGMSGLAKMLLERGCVVQGSDISQSYVTESLVERGAKIFFGHAESHVPEVATVIYSSDIAQENPELLQAKKFLCPLLHRSDLLVSLMQKQKVLAVTGTHGKTTTTAILTHVLQKAKLDPSFAVGGMMQGMVNAASGKGEYFVVEADESDGTFLKYSYFGAIVTNIDTDHLAHYGSFEKLKEGFCQFSAKAPTPELLFYCGDDVTLEGMKIPGVSYGFSEHVQCRIVRYVQREWVIEMDITFKGKLYTNIEVALTGRHNALNAAAVFGLALQLGIKEASIREALRTFSGVKRRMEKKGEISEVLILDDYAHHPTEIAVTLRALRKSVRERRVIAVYQPHRYSRLRYVMDEFTHVFQEADTLIVTDLYAAGEVPVAGVSTESLLQTIQATNDLEVTYVPRKELVDHLADYVRPHDVVITLGAGDVTKVGGELYEKLKVQGVKKLAVALLYGGKSQEYTVSIASAKHFEKNIDPELYDGTIIEISREGMWRKRKYVGEDAAVQQVEPLPYEMLLFLQQIDVCIPVFHGPNGEDGKIQGFLETLSKAYVGCDVTGCAVSMDKALTKQIAQVNNIPTAPFVMCNISEWKESREKILASVHALQLPLFVKPVHWGSTIGVHKVASFTELSRAIDEAFRCDTDLIIEQGIVGVREIEMAVLGNFDPEITLPGEILAQGQFYSYDVKYGPLAIPVASQADLTSEQQKCVMDFALIMYKASRCQGLARVDFFLDKEGQFWFNEINPMPGFTPTSLYPKMWEHNGRSMKEVVTQAIILALSRKRTIDRMYNYSRRAYCHE